MASADNRVMVTIPPDLEKEIDLLKQEIYYNKSFAEMYRDLLRLGLDSLHNVYVDE